MVLLPAVPILLIILLELVVLPGPRPPRARPHPASGAPTVVLGPGAAETARRDSIRTLVDGVLTSAEALRGIRYVYGGQAPGTGFDCSGFVGYVYRLHGIPLPRTSRAQARFGHEVPADPEAYRPGDLLFFDGGGGVVDHVALYAGDGLFLHASEAGGEVRLDPLTGPGGAWYRDRLVGVRRVVD